MTDKKKIFDITPRQKDSIIKPAKEPRFPKAEAEAKVLKPAEPSRKPILSIGKLAPFFLGVILVLGATFSYFFISPRVKVEIWPGQKIIEENVLITVSATSGNENHIAGEIIKEEKTVFQDFPATGTKLKSIKARGVIRVYNNYSTASQPLLAATRFVSDDGKLFRTPVKVVIPGGHYEGGKLAAGFIDVEVAADQPGEDYNINPSTFSVPGFAGTPKYTAFYAKSFEPMSGGLLENVSQITKADLAGAKEILTQKAISEAESALKGSVSSNGYIAFSEAVVGGLDEFKSEAEAGQEAESFTAQAKATVHALVFKESNLKDFAINYIRKKISQEEKITDNSLKTEYFFESVNSAKSAISLKLAISARSYSIFGDTQIKEMIKNKTAKEVEAIIKSLPGIEKARIDFWPFWVNSAPGNLEGIDIVLHL